MTTTRTTPFLLAVIAALVLACGGSSDEASSDGAAWPGDDALADLTVAASSGFVGVTASAEDAGYPASSAVDGNLGTRWRALGKGQYITGDLGAFKSVGGLRIAWYSGAARRFTFQIQVRLSTGAVVTVYSGQSSGTTDQLQLYSFAPITTRYLRVVVNGNTVNDYASITEMAVPSGAAPAAVAVAVSPGSASVAAGASQQFTASVTGSGNTSVSWTVQEGAAGGAVSSTGLYTAPSTAGTFHVVATSSADPSKSASATVSVAPPAGVNVAPPNGSDDTASFNAAIAAANGGTVNVTGSGTYLLRAVAVNKPNTTIVCTGTTPATLKLKALASGDGSALLNVTAANFTLKNCVLDGNKAAQAGYPEGFNDSYMGRKYRAGIWMSNASGLTVSHCTFHDFYGAAITTRETNQVVVSDNVFRDDYFEALFATTSTVSGTPGKRLTGIRFLRNTVQNARSHGSSVNSNGAVVAQYQDVVVDGNLIDGVERNAFKLENCAGTPTQYSAVTNNDFRNTDMYGALGFQSGAHYFNVSGNKLTNVAAGIGFGAVVNLQYPSDTNEYVNFTNNTIVSVVHPGGDGFQLIGYGPSMHDIRIDHNTISNVPRDAIQIRQTTAIFPSPTAYNISITNNTITSAGRCVDIYTAATSGYVTPTNVTNSGNTCN